MENRLITLVESRIRRNVYVRFGGEYLETCHSNMVRRWILSLQRDGRGIRKGNDIAKLHADNKVDVIIYAVEKSLDAYKFGLLHNKQLFIRQLKNNSLGSRTIDEGSMDEKSGMNFSEYVAILSGNTDLLEKAKLEKKINALESERRSFEKGKSSAIYKLDDSNRQLDSNKEFISRMTQDWGIFTSRVQKDREGNCLNPIKLDNFDSIDLKVIGKKLNDIADNARTNTEYFNIGELYGFKIVVKSEPSQKEGVLFNDNRFFVVGDSGVKYSYNNGHLAVDPLTASKNFINALDKIPSMLEQYEEKNRKIEADIPVLKEVVESSWKKEPELKELKSELAALERRIQLTLTTKLDVIDGKIIGKEEMQKTVLGNGMDNKRSSHLQSVKEIIESAGSRLIIAGMKEREGKNEVTESPAKEATIQPLVQQTRRFKL